jgi:DNA-binding response OmpR family regulator
MATILIIDDERHIRELYFLELSAEGYYVATMAGGSMVLEELEVLNPDVIVLDIRLVDHDGLDLLLKIRQGHPELPVILCSAYDSYRCDPRALAADAYVVKSYDLSELKSRVQRVLEASMPTDGSFLPAVAQADRGSTTGRVPEISKGETAWFGWS